MTEMDRALTPRELEILQHSLGVDQYGRFPREGQYRNFFCAGPADEPTCRELVSIGYMQEHGTSDVYPHYNCSVTDAGRMAMFEQSPNPPKLTRSQKRYQQFLDADCGVSFREWLRCGYWKEAIHG